MEKVDKTIEAICDWIQKELNNADFIESDGVSKMTSALAELVSARAQYEKKKRMNYINVKLRH